MAVRALNKFDNKMVQVTDTDGRLYTGIADHSTAEYGLHEFGREEESLCVNGYQLFEKDIKEISLLPGLSLIRAAETWQQAGAYYVRIQAMAKKHHITLREEFDEHDGPETRYIVVTDEDFPIATARMYPMDPSRMMIGRVVVLPEYRRRGIGTMVVSACEEWAEDLGFSRTLVESRDNKTGFYREIGYEITGEMTEGPTFRCVRMEKQL